MDYIDLVKRNEIDLENFPQDLLNRRDDVFRYAVMYGRMNIVDKLLELTTDDSLKFKMIHCYRDTPFKFAVENNRLEMVDKLLELTPNEPERFKMINADYYYPLEAASDRGHLDMVNKVLGLISDDLRLFIPMMRNSFKSAAGRGYWNVCSRLLESVSDESKKSQIINESFDYAFIKSSAYGHFEVANNLLELIPEESRKSKLEIFEECFSLNSGYINDFKKNGTIEWATVILDEESSRFADYLKEDRIIKLKEIKVDLIDSLGGKLSKVNAVMSGLLIGDNLKKVLRFVNRDFIDNERIDDVNAELSRFVKASLPDDVVGEVDSFLGVNSKCDVEFPFLNRNENAVVFQTFHNFFVEKPRSKIKLDRASVEGLKTKGPESSYDI